MTQVPSGVAAGVSSCWDLARTVSWLEDLRQFINLSSTAYFLSRERRIV